MALQNAYDNHVHFRIEPHWEDDVRKDISSIDEITFEYTAPAFSVDTSGRYAEHEIIGGTTVRQKIGEDPVEVDITGVCFESTAMRIDALRNAKYVTIYSSRIPGDTLDVHVASTSTSPLADSGAVKIDDDSDEFLHEYTLSCVEVNAAIEIEDTPSISGQGITPTGDQDPEA